MADPKPNVFQKIARFARFMHSWAADKFGDPAIAGSLREDLGLKPGEGPAELDNDRKDKIDAFVAKAAGKIDEQALAQTAEQLIHLFTTLRDFVESAKADGADTWDVLNLLFQVCAHDSLRLRNPSAYAFMRLAGLLVQEEDTLGQLDPAMLTRALRGEGADMDALVERLSLLTGALVVALERIVHVVDVTLDATYGWDGEPGDDSEAAGVAGRTLTLAFVLPNDVNPVLTLVAVPRAHGGPGLFFTASTGFEVSHEIGATKYTFGVVGDAFGLFVPLSSQGKPRAFGPNLSPSVSLRVDPAESPDPTAAGPALVLGTDNATRLEIGAFGFGFDIGSDHAGFRVSARKGKLVIGLGEGDGFLARLPVGAIEIPFDLGLVADTVSGLRLEGGTGLRVFLPIAASLAGVFTIQYLELELKLAGTPALDLRGGFSLKLGPFKAAVDGVGMTLDLSRLREGFDLAGLVKFAPPWGIGLALEAGPVKGGGYLYIDAERGEYAGALELSIMAIGIKAIGVLSTRRPDGSEGWALLLFIFGQFNVPIGFGIFWTGLGGMIGLHHRADTDALTVGMASGALDDVLFPADPIADAPRIINRYRQLFPIEPGSLLLGPMLELSFSQPPIVRARLGFIFEVQNALDDGPVRLTKVVLLGQLLAELPPREAKAPVIVRLLVDVVGFYDAEEKFLMIRARLRDSFVGIEGFAKIDLSGELLLAMRFGDPPSFVLSAGGFHPAFRDLPVGVPSRLERLSVSFKIGPVAMRSEQYFAITSNSVQGGYRTEMSANFGVASISGWLGFDALLYLAPRFHFLVGVTFNVALHAFGTNIASVKVDMSLEGPGEWHLVGKFSFSILCWDEEVSFDERWGSAPAVEIGTTSAAAALLAELNAPRRLEPQGPIGGNGLVTLAKVEGDLVIAHPLGQFVVRQKAVPFGVRIDRMGTKRLTEGTPLFEITAVRVAGEPATSWEPITDHFARGQFMELSERDRLSGSSFERFPCGVTVGTERFSVPTTAHDVTVQYERKLLLPQRRFRMYWMATPLPVAAMPFAVAARSAFTGGAARSLRARRDALVATVAPAAVQSPKLAVVNTITLDEAAPLSGAGLSSPTIAGQRAAVGSIVVEAYEVAS